MTREEFNQKTDEILSNEKRDGTAATVQALQELLKQMRESSKAYANHIQGIP